MASKNILFLHDGAEFRGAVSEYLQEGGYGVVQGSTAEQTLQAPKSEAYFAFLLNIDLGPEASGIGQVLNLDYQQFPDAGFAHESVLANLSRQFDSRVNGKVLLPMIRSLSPVADIIMLTGTYHDSEQELYMRKWGASVTVQKLAEDNTFLQADPVPGLKDEFLRYFDDISQEQLYG